MGLFEWLQGIFCKDKIETIKILQVTNELNIKDLQIFKEKYNILQINYEKLIRDFDLIKDEKINIPEDIRQKAISIRDEYPIANILYAGYTIKIKNGVITPQIKVQDFIQVLTSHRKWVEDKKLTLKDYLKKELPFGEAVNRLMFDIYKEYAPTKKYVLDAELYGVDEQWAPTIDSWYLRFGDCENSTNELMCLFEAAGLIGELKNFYWNVCGNTPLGGHSTLYVYDLKNNVWRHVETTATIIGISDFYSLPTNKDQSDKLNITSVWWSFNSDLARHTFKTEADESKFIKRERFRDIIIIKEMRRDEKIS